MTGKVPKTKQIYFFMMPEETSRVLQFIYSNNCKIYSSRSDKNIINVIEFGDVVAQLYFSPHELMDNIEMFRIAEGVYALDATVSPVIEFDCSRLYDDKLSRGRMYFRGGYTGKNEWISFPNSLFKAFMSVYNFMKKEILTNKKEYLGYISKNCELYIQQGNKLIQI